MARQIHPTAVVHPGAELGEHVVIGPHAVIGDGVVIGEGSEIGASAQLHGPTVLGRENRIFPLAAVGFDPQDLKFQGELVRLEIGDRNHFREFSTVHRGTGKGGGLTTVGHDNLFMTGSHVAHDCHVGNRTVFVNNATLAGHVDVEDDATIGAFSSVHQFCRVGRHAYVGGYTVLTMDALPYVKTTGQKPACYGLNSIGLARKGFDEESIRRLSAALRVVLRSGLPLSDAIAKVKEALGSYPEVAHLVHFVETSKRGVVKALPGRKKSGRGATGSEGGGEP